MSTADLREPARPDEEARTRRALLHMLEDLQRERRAAREAQRRWIETVDAIGDPIVVHDAQLRIVRANRAYFEIAGSTSQDLIGKPFWESFPRASGPPQGCIACACARSGRHEEIATPGGSTFLSRAFPLQGSDPAEIHALHVFQNVSVERRRSALETVKLARRERQAMALAALSLRPALLAGDVEVFSNELTEGVAGASEVRCASVWLLEPDGLGLRCIDHFDAATRAHVRGMELRQEHFQAKFHALESFPYVAADDARSDPRTRGYAANGLEPAGISSLLDVAIEGAGRPVGLVCLEHVGGPRHWEEDEIAFARHAAETLAITLANRDRKASERALRRANRALRTLSAGDEAMVRIQDETDLVAATTRILTAVGEYRWAAVAYASAEPGRAFEIRSASELEAGTLPRLADAGARPGRGAIARAIAQGAPQVVEDVFRDPEEAAWADELHAAGISKLLALPLRLPDAKTPLGAVCVAGRDEIDDAALAHLEELAANLGYGIGNIRTESARKSIERALRASLEATVGAISATMESRDPYTAGHQRRVAMLAAAIAREMRYPRETVEGVHFGAVIHDIGKIQVPAEILSKPKRLSPIEFELIKTHAQAGFEILSGVTFPWPVALMVVQHHERLDGSGYPQGLEGDQIIPESRILAVADVVEAMSSHRPYRPGRGIEAALGEVVAHKGTWFDASVVDACVRLFGEGRFRFE